MNHQSDKYTQLLLENGFKPLDHENHFGKGGVPYVYYASRKRGTVHEYVSLIYYMEEFCESVYELYCSEKNTRSPKGNLKKSESAKRGFTTLLSALPHTVEQLREYVTKSEEDTKLLSNTLFEHLLDLEKKKD